MISTRPLYPESGMPALSRCAWRAVGPVVTTPEASSNETEAGSLAAADFLSRRTYSASPPDFYKWLQSRLVLEQLTENMRKIYEAGPESAGTRYQALQ